MSIAAFAAPPYLFAQQGDQPSPATYVIPGSLVVQPTASTATFDGTAAAGSFLAALSFYAQSGELLSRVFSQQAVAAGDVAQVSYAPFPGGLASTGGTPLRSQQESLSGNVVSCANNATADLSWDSSNGPDSLVDFSNPLLPVYTQDGIYIVTFSIATDVATPLSNGSYFNGVGAASLVGFTGASGKSYSAVAANNSPTWVGTDQAGALAGDGPAAQAGLRSGTVARNFFLNQAVVLRLY